MQAAKRVLRRDERQALMLTSVAHQHFGLHSVVADKVGSRVQQLPNVLVKGPSDLRARTPASQPVMRRAAALMVLDGLAHLSLLLVGIEPTGFGAAECTSRDGLTRGVASSGDRSCYNREKIFFGEFRRNSPGTAVIRL